MEYFGADFFFFSISFCLTLLGVFPLWLVTKREGISFEDRGEFVALAPTPISVSVNPDVELAEIEAAAEVNAEEIQASFEELVDELSIQKEEEI